MSKLDSPRGCQALSTRLLGRRVRFERSPPPVVMAELGRTVPRQVDKYPGSNGPDLNLLHCLDHPILVQERE